MYTILVAATLHQCFKHRGWQPRHPTVLAYTVAMFFVTMAKSILSARLMELVLIEAPTLGTQEQDPLVCSATVLAHDALSVIQYLLSDALMVRI
jgi:hypothetical protein